MTGKKKKVVIIGGGITGLSAAFYMQEEIREKNLEAETVLIESSPRLGGKIQTVHKDGFIIERGPDSFLERKTSGPQFVKDVGLGSELVNNATGRSYVLVGERLHPIPAGAVMGIPTQIMPFVTTGLFPFLEKHGQQATLSCLQAESRATSHWGIFSEGALEMKWLRI